MATIPSVNTDSLPPHMDKELYGQVKIIRLTADTHPIVERVVQIVFATVEIYAAYDLKSKNLYIVDRQKKLSLGCHSKADLYDAPEGLGV